MTSFASRCSVLLSVAAFVCLARSVASCRIYEPANKPIDGCRHDCAEIAVAQCTDSECERGCEFILDRIAERAEKNVLACVAKSSRRCSDVVWAECSARVGVHADGGPPAPPPPPDED